jgi:hypothetical protein
MLVYMGLCRYIPLYPATARVYDDWQIAIANREDNDTHALREFMTTGIQMTGNLFVNFPLSGLGAGGAPATESKHSNEHCKLASIFSIAPLFPICPQ